MLVDVDLNKPKIKSKLYLAKINKSIIGSLKEAYGIKNNIKLGEMSELEFSLPINLEINHILQRNPHIDLINTKFLIKLTRGTDTEWYQIEKIIDSSDNNADSKIVHCLSLSYEMNNPKIRSYYGESKNAEQVLTEVLLSAYDVSNISKALWKFDYINPEFNLTFRKFDISSKSLLDFLFSDITEAFDCIVKFNTENRTFSLYKKDEIGQNKGLQFNYGKYLKSINKELDPSNFCTKLKCFGADDLTIIEISPFGKNMLLDFSFYLFPYEEDEFGNVIQHSKYMSDSLAGAVLDYNQLIASKDKQIQTAEVGTNESTIKLTNHGLITGDYILNRSRENVYREVTYQDDNTIIISNVEGQVSGDTIYKFKNDTFGKLLYQKKTLQEQLTVLQNEKFILDTDLSIILDNIAVEEEIGNDVSDLIDDRDAKESQIDAKIVEINNKQGQIDAKTIELTNLQTLLSIEANFTDEQFYEIQSYIITQDFEDQNYIDVYDLYEAGVKKLSEINAPMTNIDIDIVNFLEVVECQHDWDKLVLGDTVSIKHDKLNIDNKANIIEIEFNEENGDIKLVVGDIKNVESEKDKVLKLLYQSIYTGNKLNQKAVNWNAIAQNFDGRNDRNNITPADPIVANDGTTINHTINTDGSCNISFEWTFEGTGGAYNIDGFFIRVRSSNSDQPYVFGSNVALEDAYTVDSSQRNVVRYGTPANKYYTFGVQAYRKVDADINPDGILVSNIIKSTFSTENPYLPEENIAFNGNITGTINGKPVTDVTNFLDVIYPDDLENLQNQIDGQISTWFYSFEPTLLNLPASEWTTNTDKDKHLGDLFYDLNTGYGYRFAYATSVYQWIKITDTDVVKALADAANAQDTADSKRRIFVTTPTVPYDIGDLWTPGTSGQIRKCKTAKALGQVYSILDWEIASDALSEHNTYNSVKITQANGVQVFDNQATPQERVKIGQTGVDKYGVQLKDKFGNINFDVDSNGYIDIKHKDGLFDGSTLEMLYYSIIFGE